MKKVIVRLGNGLGNQLFTYAVMKLLNEFMAQKYMALHNISIACTRPSVVFGPGDSFLNLFSI